MSSKRFGSGSGHKLSSKNMSNSTSNNSMTRTTPGGHKVGAGEGGKFTNTQKSTAPKKIS